MTISHKARHLIVLTATVLGLLAFCERVAQGQNPPGGSTATGQPSLSSAPHLVDRAGWLKTMKSLVEANPKLSEHSYMSAAEILARREYCLERGIMFTQLVRGNPENREICLTFDDGPHPDYTPRILEILRREKVPATFFVVGKMVDRHPELVRQEVAEGHEVANHTYHHLRLNSIPRETIISEMHEGSLAIERATGSPTRLFRPPGGEYDEDVVHALKALNYVMVFWTDNPGDYHKPGVDVIEDRVLGRANNGGIVLMHDGVQQTIEALPTIIQKLKQRGFTFVTSAHMARERGVITTGAPRHP